MIRSYFKMALRVLRRQPGYSFISVGGLALGLACCYLIALYVQHELSYDRFHEKADRTYLLLYSSLQNGVEQTDAFFPASTGLRLKESFPEIEDVVRYWNSGVIARVEGEPFNLSGFYPVDPSFLEVFSFPLVEGDAATALRSPDSAVLVESQAEALFGSESPIGKTISVVSFAEPVDLTVTGIMEDPPTNTWFSGMKGIYHFNALAANFGRGPIVDGEEGPSNFHVFLTLKPGTRAGAFRDKSGPFVQQEFQPAAQDRARLALQPLTDLRSGSANRRAIYIFSAVAVLILLMACVNVINLATARAARRAKEVGVRKTLGARRRQLVAQFIMESMLLSLLSIVIGALLVPLLWPVFVGLIGQNASIAHARNLASVGMLLVIGLLAAVAAGSYPAFYLSALRPASVLKGKSGGTPAAVRLRRGLIVLQFSISIFLIAGTLTMSDQIDFMKSRPLGFEKEHVIVATTSPSIRDRLDVFKQQLVRNPSIVSVTAANGVPGRYGSTRTYTLPEHPETSWTFRTLFADPEYLDVLGIDLRAGRFFMEVSQTDLAQAALLNETAARQLGMADPVGRLLQEGDVALEVIGVVEDFHFQGVGYEIGPLVVRMDPMQSWFVAARIAPEEADETLVYMKEQWASFDPNWVFNPSFLDELFDRQYATQERQGDLFTALAILALFIACLGSLGLSAYSAEQRTKEIGIRKVLGATLSRLAMMLTREFMILVALGFVIAVPAAYLMMQRWLEDFAYRIDPSWQVFVAAGLLVLCVALATVSYHAIRAAAVNPVRSLRYE